MASHPLSVCNAYPSRVPEPESVPRQPQTAACLEKEGFPEHAAQAFLQTAQGLQSVIPCRVPGKVATGLIDYGYCLKSFYVHAASRDWGPMADFVAFFPTRNKKGAGNIGCNQKAHLETKEKLDKLKDNDTSSLFVPLGLTVAAFKRLDTVGNREPKYLAGIPLVMPIENAFDADCTAFMESPLPKEDRPERAKAPIPVEPDHGWTWLDSRTGEWKQISPPSSLGAFTTGQYATRWFVTTMIRRRSGGQSGVLSSSRLPTLEKPCTDRGPTPEAFGMLLSMREHGLPDSVGRLFFDTAVTLKSALLIQVPGKDAPELNTDGGSSTNILTDQSGISLTVSAAQSVAGSGWKARKARR